MTSYVFREVVPLRDASKLDPQRVGELISKVKREHGDNTADALWRAARNPRHYLHKCYQWDVQKAAEAHWRDTSQRIMRCIYAIDDETEQPAPAFVSVKDGSRRDWYEPREITNSLSLQYTVLRGAKRDLDAWASRYRMLADVCLL